MGAPLQGVTVALPETRELDLFTRMLEERGAAIWRCPLVSILDTPDQASVTSWLRDVVDHGLDWLVLLTGEGLRRLVAAAERAGLREAFLSRIAQARKLTRGPKPVRALRELELSGDMAADEPTTAGVIATLQRQALAGRRVGVQLYGERNPALIDFLTGAGATVLPVAPYVYASAAEDARVIELIDGLADGRIRILAFTSKTQVERLFRCASGADRADMLARGLERTTLAAVGPVVAETLSERGWPPTLVPTGRYFMKPLVREIVAHVTARCDT